jgi:hypothetical protein
MAAKQKEHNTGKSEVVRNLLKANSWKSQNYYFTSACREHDTMRPLREAKVKDKCDAITCELLVAYGWRSCNVLTVAL